VASDREPRQPKPFSDESGTALHPAIRFRHSLLAQFLISKGVSLDTPEGEGKTPVERAEEIAADHPDYDAAPAENEPRENEPRENEPRENERPQK
jgi:hypothetical protein